MRCLSDSRREDSSQFVRQFPAYSFCVAHHPSDSSCWQSARKLANPHLGPPHRPFGWSLWCRYKMFGPFVLHTKNPRSLYMLWTSFDTSKPAPNIGTSTSSSLLVSRHQGHSLSLCLLPFSKRTYYIHISLVKSFKTHFDRLISSLSRGIYGVLHLCPLFETCTL